MISVNEGADVQQGNEVLANINVQQMLRDLNLPDGKTAVRCPEKDQYNRFAYIFMYGKRNILVLMPGVPLAEMKKGAASEQAPPRLLVGENGNSWYWEFALNQIESELRPIVGTLTQTGVEESTIIGMTDDALPDYIRLIRSALETLAEEGLPIDPKIDLTAENLRAVRVAVDEVLGGMRLIDMPKFLRPEKGFDIKQLASNPFPGIEYGYRLPMVKLRSECASDREYRSQVVHTSCGDLYWVKHPRDIDWKTRFESRDGKTYIEIQNDNGALLERWNPEIERRITGK